eukprot:5417512-Pleurochrysis_carterae.AAC.3
MCACTCAHARSRSRRARVLTPCPFLSLTHTHACARVRARCARASAHVAVCVRVCGAQRPHLGDEVEERAERVFLRAGRHVRRDHHLHRADAPHDRWCV